MRGGDADCCLDWGAGGYPSDQMDSLDDEPGRQVCGIIILRICGVVGFLTRS